MDGVHDRSTESDHLLIDWLGEIAKVRQGTGEKGLVWRTGRRDAHFQ
jgi:hypothetical protein